MPEEPIHEAERQHLTQEAARLNVDVQNYDFASRLRASGRDVHMPVTEQALEAMRAKLAGIRDRLAEIARVQADERKAAEREAEAVEAKRRQEIIDARRAALVARMAFDRAQAARLQASLGEDLKAYEKAIDACDTARSEQDRAERALAQLEE